MSAKAPHRPPTILDWFKPRKAEAIARLRSNSIAAASIFVLTHLISILPTPWTCFWLLVTGGRNMGRWTRVLCWIEIAVFALLGLNILQAYYALRNPPPPFPPLDSPAKRAQQKSGAPMSSPRPLNLTSPKSVSQRPFSMTSSTTTTGPTSHLPYQPSPLSSPSRIINYKSAASPFSPSTPISNAKASGNVPKNIFDTTSVNSNMTSPSFSLSSPGGPNFSMSSPLAGYTRGRNARMGAARPVDGNLLSRLQAADDEDDDY